MSNINNNATLNDGATGPVMLRAVGVSDVSFTNTAGVSTTLTIPADYLTVGQKYEIRATGSVTKTALVSTNLAVTYRMNGSTILNSTVALGTGTSGHGWTSFGSFTVRAIGTSGSIYPELNISVNTIADVNSNNTTSVTINTKVSNTFNIAVSGSDAGTTGTIRSYHIVQIT